MFDTTFIELLFCLFIVPPKIITRPSNQTVLENEEVKLHCAAIGNPIPKILWMKDGITIGTGENLMLKAWRNASGTYTCMAKNLLNATAISNAHVDVQCKYK